jgi:phospho-N-acetylmuramoyl-pentapeptide-transferase
MLYEWLAPLGDEFQLFNLFNYITFRVGGALMTSLIIFFIFGEKMINALRSRQGKGQPIRDDGPESHIIQKAGTPTMGGLMILMAVVISTLLWGDLTSPFLWTIFFVTVGFGAIGFYDDYLKVSRQSHKGFSGKLRLLAEFVIAAIAVWFLTTAFPQDGNFATGLAIPLLKDFLINLGWFFIPFGCLVIVGTANAVNLTDGLDGLAIVPVMIACMSLAFIAYLVGNAIFSSYLGVPHVPGSGEITIFLGAIVYGRYRIFGFGRRAGCDCGRH